jgi:hypothetical protein
MLKKMAELPKVIPLASSVFLFRSNIKVVITMLIEHEQNAYVGIGTGWFCGHFGAAIVSDGGDIIEMIIGAAFMLLGFGIFAWGFVSGCVGKGYSRWLGLLSLLNIIGVAILIALPDKCKHDNFLGVPH